MPMFPENSPDWENTGLGFCVLAFSCFSMNLFNNRDFEAFHLLRFWCKMMLSVSSSTSGWPTNPGNPGRPWTTLDFVCPWKNTLENPKVTTHFWKIMFWSRSSTHQFLVLQCYRIFYSCNAEEEDLWGYWGVKTSYHLSCGKQPLFPSADTKFQVKRRMKLGWVQAEDTYVIIILFENIVKSTLKNPKIWQNIPWKTLEKNSISLLATLYMYFIGLTDRH